METKKVKKSTIAENEKDSSETIDKSKKSISGNQNPNSTIIKTSGDSKKDSDIFENMSSEEINDAIKCGCRVILQRNDDNGISYDIIIEEKYWLELQEKTKTECIKTLKVPGFRRGNAPQKEIDRIVNEAYVLNISAQNASRHASEVINSNKSVKHHLENDFYVVLVKLSPQEIILNYSFIVRPKVDVSFLDNFKISLPEKPRVNQADFQKMVKNQIKSRAGKLVPVHREIKIDDVVNLNFAGFDTDGKEIPNTKGKDFALEIGSKSFIPGFEQNLFGLEVGEEKSFKITFPKKYFNKKLQGQTARFDVKILKISKIVVPKEVDDVLIKSFKLDKVVDLNSFHNFCHRLLMNDANTRWSQQINNIAINDILKTAKLEIDSKIITSEINAIMHSLSEQARINKIPIEDVAVRAGMNPKSISDDIRIIAEKRVKLTIMIREYIKNKKISLPQKEVDEQYAIYLKQLPKNTAKVDILAKQTFSQNVISNHALKMIIEQIYDNSDQLAQAQRKSKLRQAVESAKKMNKDEQVAKQNVDKEKANDSNSNSKSESTT